MTQTLNCPDIRGFNYQPSYGSTSLENWLSFDEQVFELELRRGKQFFPEMNTIRTWLSWDAFIRNPEKFAENFERSLQIADSLGLVTVPILFNRWHDADLDCGGIYFDHFMPGWSWLTRLEWEKKQDDLFGNYLDIVVGRHIEDARILYWDICNEPFSYMLSPEEVPSEVEAAEYAWLERMSLRCRRLGATQPIGISVHAKHGRRGLERIAPLSDILMIHPYYPGPSDDEAQKQEFTKLLDEYVAVSVETGKPLLATETCWGGSEDDEWRVTNIHFTLSELKKRGIGWTVHLLHHSLVADAHRSPYGPVADCGYFAFIEADGSLRKGHEVFNIY
ncbi:cellulase family glycosylhydrolase [Cohnella abietis]|uniref:Glycoside hydrolase family 5 domain-containing protein n=1 Tax=Cohnella abietis TaxID=2507935 RepID=A0A3T1DC48_9BACL|nr:cellulase family glycosylhydrolase [Cohnella abietis]BBI35614.1 hypothetical protein KCTCHS21_50130 [Cohnella abietis]